MESLILAAVIKSVWWGIDLYANYRLTREMLILEGVGAAMKAAQGQQAAAGGRTPAASRGTLARTGLAASSTDHDVVSPISAEGISEVGFFQGLFWEGGPDGSGDPNVWKFKNQNLKRKQKLLEKRQSLNNPGHDLSYAGGRQLLGENKFSCSCPFEVSNPNPLLAGVRWLAEKHARSGAAEALEPIPEEHTFDDLAHKEELGLVREEEAIDGTDSSDEENSRGLCKKAALGILGCAKATGIRLWNCSLWAPVENDATGTLPGICVKDGLQLAAVLGITARIYIPVLMGDAFLTNPGSNGVLGTAQ